MDEHKFILFQNFVAGGCGGITATLVGHPFDTIKVNLNLNKIKMIDIIEVVLSALIVRF